MRIAYIAAGAAGMYCGACLHDNALASRLIRMGHDVALMPTYTPVRTDETNVSVDRVFYGAINVYLEQKSALFRHTPWLLDRMLNSPRLLAWASKRSASVDARGLGALTLSVLQGQNGRQAKELDKLVAWLRDEYRPELVQLSNSMLLGMARRIRSELHVPVLCAVQGEEIFIEGLEEPYRQQVRSALRERARDADGFIAGSRYYVDFMSEYLEVSPERIHQINLGLNLEGYGENGSAKIERPFTIGYLARICPEKGLHLLVEAFRRLAEKAGPDHVRLRIAGYLGERDRAYCEGILSQIDSWGLKDAVDYLGEVNRKQKIDFLNTLHVLSVPTTYREPKGLFALEALACAVPVALPRHGAFPELVEATGGGVLVEPDSAGDLARGLGELMDDPERRRRLGQAGQQVVRREYNDEIMAENTLRVYRGYL